MTEPLKPIARQSDLVLQELDSELLIYDLTRSEAFSLNETSALAFRLCNGTRNITEISQAMTTNLKMPISEDLVWLALDDLRRNGFLEGHALPADRFVGLTRREVLRRVGFASMVALPIIASVIAPRSVSAQSCLVAGMICTPAGAACCPNSLCSSGTCGCQCITHGDCILQTRCPNTNNCNPSGLCAPN